jgi:hypothetical protein
VGDLLPIMSRLQDSIIDDDEESWYAKCSPCPKPSRLCTDHLAILVPYASRNSILQTRTSNHALADTRSASFASTASRIHMKKAHARTAGESTMKRQSSSRFPPRKTLSMTKRTRLASRQLPSERKSRSEKSRLQIGAILPA